MNTDLWAYRAFVALYIAALFVIVGQLARSPGPVQEVSLPPVESPSESYYGPRDTSAIARLCCRVSR